MWDKFIDPALMAYRTTKHTTIRIIPFLLIYDRKAVLLIDKPYDLRMRDCMMQIVKKVLYIRKET